MGRINLFEIEDQRWCPGFIREATTDILFALFSIFHIYEPAYQKINELLDKTDTHSIIDCCSGSGGPMVQLREYLNKKGKDNVSITLSDKYPNVKLFQLLASTYPNQIKGHLESLDASQVPASFKGIRTFFSCFHHFKPEDAKKILQDAISNNAPICIFESVSRHPVDFLRALLSPILVPFLIPFSKRLTWYKFLFTYIVPLIPLSFTWDYIASNLRSYSIKEMHALVNQLNAPHYHWEIGKLWSRKAKGYIYYLIGHGEV